MWDLRQLLPGVSAHTLVVHSSISTSSWEDLRCDLQGQKLGGNPDASQSLSSAVHPPWRSTLDPTIGLAVCLGPTGNVLALACLHSGEGWWCLLEREVAFLCSRFLLPHFKTLRVQEGGRKEKGRASSRQVGSLGPLLASGPLSYQEVGYGVPWDTVRGLLWWRG